MSAFTDLIAELDLAVMDELGGEPVIYRPAAGAAVQVIGIFDAQYVLVQGDAQAGVESSAPVVFLRLADLPTDPEIDEPILTIRGTDYHINDPKPDGIGGVLITLRKVT